MPHYFNSSMFVKNYLAYGWNSYSISDLIGLMAVSFALAWAYEMVRLLTQEVFAAGKIKALIGSAGDAPSCSNGHEPISMVAKTAHGEDPADTVLTTKTVSKQRYTQRRFKAHMANSVMYTLSYGFGSLLMLAVMCFNIWILIAFCVGHACGQISVAMVQRWRLRKRIRECLKRGLQGLPCSNCAVGCSF